MTALAKLLTDYLGELWTATTRGWNRFWFTPSDPATLGLIRILAGAMLFYTHLVWGLDLMAFFGPNAWLDWETVKQFQRNEYFWTYLNYLRTPTALWVAHYAALAVFAMLTVGLWSRVTSVLSFLIAVAYVNRVIPAHFGLDHINVLLAMYLMVGPCGGAYSVDRLIARRRTGNLAPSPPSPWTNVAIRLIQIHMAIIYLFAGLGKQGMTWHNGEAMWYAFANREYQSLDMTWMASPWGVYPSNIMTHITIVWELSYIVLIWPRLTRPIMLALAIPLHFGIAFCMGMMTFGLIMLVANLAFIPPWLVRMVIERKGREASAVPDPQRQAAIAPRRRRA